MQLAVQRPEFIVMMNYMHHSRTTLKIPKCDGIKRRLVKMGDDTIDSVSKMFSVQIYISLLYSILTME